MRSPKSRRLWPLAFVLLALGSPFVLGQEAAPAVQPAPPALPPPATVAPTTTPGPDKERHRFIVVSPESTATPAPAPTPVPAKEQTIYVPYEQLEKVFEKQDRGIFMPYREFLELWNKVNLPAKIREIKPPVAATLAAAHYAGKVEGDSARIEAKFSFEALQKGWSSLKLGASGLAIAEAKTSATLSSDADGYEILFPEKGSYALDATIYGQIQREAGKSTLELPLPKTAASQFELLIPEKGLKFTIEPASAFTATETPEGQTRLLVYFGGSEKVKLTWTRPAAETTLKPLLFSESETSVQIHAGTVRTEARVNYQILRTGIDKLDLSVPADQQVLSVEGKEIREWGVDAAPAPGQPQKIHLAFHSPIRDSYELRLTLERPLANLPQNVPFPEIATLGAERQTGAITVQADPELVAEVSGLKELTQQPTSEAASKGANLIGRYRYFRPQYSASVSITEAKPLVEAESETLVTVQPDSLKLQALFNITVKRAGIFDLAIDLPPGFSHVEATGEEISGQSIQTAGNRSTLALKFKSRVTGKIAFEIEGEAVREKADAPLTTPVFAPHTDRHEAKLGIAIHQSLKANTSDKGDLREEDIQTLASSSQARGPDKQPLYAYAPSLPGVTAPLTLGFHYRSLTAKPAVIQFELRKPRVSAEVLTSLEVRESLLRQNWTISYNIEYAGVNELSIEVPSTMAEDLQIEGGNIKERSRTEAKDAKGTSTGGAVWRVTLQEKVLGPYELHFSHETPRTPQEQGKPDRVSLLEIRPLGLFRETGQIAVAKDGNVELVKSEPKGLEPIDPKELDPRLVADGIFLAWKYAAHPYGLDLEVAKNLYLPVPRAVASYAVLTTVIAEDEAETTEAVYWVRNNGQQFLSIALPTRNGGAKLLSDAFVDGEPQQPSHRPDRNELLIRLPAQEVKEAFPVRFVYEVPSPHPGEKLRWHGDLALDPPVLSEIETLQARWTLYLPPGHDYFGFAGPMQPLTSEPGWNAFREAFDFLVPQIGPGAPESGAPAESDPPTLSAPKIAGFDTQLHLEGKSYTLRRLGAPAEVRIAHRSLTYSAVREAIAILLTLLAGLIWARGSTSKRLVYVLGIGGGAAIVAGAVEPHSAGVWQAIYLGALGCGGVWIVVSLWGRLTSIRLFRRKAPTPTVTSPPPRPRPVSTPTAPPSDPTPSSPTASASGPTNPSAVPPSTGATPDSRSSENPPASQP